MKKSRIRQIIKEEISKVLKEDSDEIISRGIEYGINPEIGNEDGFDKGEIEGNVLATIDELNHFLKGNVTVEGLKDALENMLYKIQ